MKKSLSIIAYAVMCAVLVVSTGGCRKKKQESITIKGKLVQDCSGTPVGNMPLDFYLKSSSTLIGGKSGTIGETTTDLEGNFSVTGPDYGGGDLSVNARDRRVVYSFSMETNESVVDLGTVYYNSYTTSVSIKFTRAVNHPGDTLYYGVYKTPQGIAIGSDIDGHVYHVSGPVNSGGLSFSELAKWTWGIGMADYMKALDSMDVLKNSTNPPYYHMFQVRRNTCADDTTFVSL